MWKILSTSNMGLRSYGPDKTWSMNTVRRTGRQTDRQGDSYITPLTFFAVGIINGRYGDLIKQYEVSLSQMLNDILWPDHMQWQHPTDQTLFRRPFTEFWVDSIEHLQRVWHADRGRLLLRAPGPVPLWDLHVFKCRDQSLLNLSCLRTFEFRTPLGTSLLLLPNLYVSNKMSCQI